MTLDPSDIVSPSALAHIVLQTPRFDAVVAWYKLVLHATASFENDGVAFLTYDHEHHRIAFVNAPHLAQRPRGIAGVNHVAFAYPSLRVLLGNYARLRQHGITPDWAVNHGPTTSLYYSDPDANKIELQVDNFDTAEQATAFFRTDAFATNPVGVDIDPDELLARLLAGEDEKTLKRRPAGGPRMPDASLLL